MQVRLYMTDEYIFKVGSHSQDTYIVLEGQAVLVGACEQASFQKANPNQTILEEAEVIGIMRAGSHFGTDLGENELNCGHKRICHMISRQPSVVGVLSAESLQILYKSYPKWKTKLQTLNEFVFKRCELNLKKYDQQIKEFVAEESSAFHDCTYAQSKPQELRLVYIEKHLTYSREIDYDQIVKRVKYFEKTNPAQVLLHQIDLLMQQKMFFYGQEGKVFPIFDTQYQEALKKTSHESLLMQVLAGQEQLDSSIRMKTLSRDDDGKFHQLLGQCWANCYLKVNSKSRKTLDLIHTANLLYIAVITPLVIGFAIEMGPALNALEAASIIISLIWIFGNFRTQVLIKGVPTLELRTLLRHYEQNGLYFDLLGIIPLNIALGQGKIVKDGIVLRSVLRAVRIISSWRAVQLFGKAEVAFKNNQFNIIMQILKALFYIYFLGHFLACTWYFTVSQIEDGSEPTWIDFHSLDEESTSVQYLRSIYTVFNIVCSVGYGDMFPMTDIERIFFTMMITMGDLLFALAFGLITQITLQISLTDETKQFKFKLYEIQEFMNSFNLDQAQQRRVEQYFAYEYQQKYNSYMLSYDDLIGYLPYELSEEVIYQSSKEILTSMFSQYNSENMIRKLAAVLSSVIFLPGDYIIYKGDIGEEMYFIAEGSVFELSEDKQTVISCLGRGAYFGEIAILIETARQTFVQAETFCIINILKKDDFDQIVKIFPDIRKEFEDQAAQRLEEIELLKEQADYDREAPQAFLGVHVLSHAEQLKQLLKIHEEGAESSSKGPIPEQKENQGTLKQQHTNDRSSNLTRLKTVIPEESSFNSKSSSSQSSSHLSSSLHSDPPENQGEPQESQTPTSNVPRLRTSSLSPSQGVTSQTGTVNINIQNNYNIVVDRKRGSAHEESQKDAINDILADLNLDEEGQAQGPRESLLEEQKQNAQREMEKEWDNKHLPQQEEEETKGSFDKTIVEKQADTSKVELTPVLEIEQENGTTSHEVQKNSIQPAQPQKPRIKKKSSKRQKQSDKESEDSLEKFFSSSDSESLEDTGNQRGFRKITNKIIQGNSPEVSPGIPSRIFGGSPGSEQKRARNRPSYAPMGRSSSSIFDGLYLQPGGSANPKKRQNKSSNITAIYKEDLQEKEKPGLRKRGTLTGDSIPALDLKSDQPQQPIEASADSKADATRGGSETMMSRTKNFKSQKLGALGRQGILSQSQRSDRSEQPRRSSGLSRSVTQIPGGRGMIENQHSQGPQNQSTLRRQNSQKTSSPQRGSKRTPQQPTIGSLFQGQGKGEAYINHSIRRTAAPSKSHLQELAGPHVDEPRRSSRGRQQQQGNPPGFGRMSRRLSRISLGRNLTLSQTAGLKLQWTVSS